MKKQLNYSWPAKHCGVTSLSATSRLLHSQWIEQSLLIRLFNSTCGYFYILPSILLYFHIRIGCLWWDPKRNFYSIHWNFRYFEFFLNEMYCSEKLNYHQLHLNYLEKEPMLSQQWRRLKVQRISWAKIKKLKNVKTKYLLKTVLPGSI